MSKKFAGKIAVVTEVSTGVGEATSSLEPSLPLSMKKFTTPLGTPL